MGSESQVPPGGQATRRTTASRWLAAAHVYRPGPLLAATTLLGPAAVALASAIGSLAVWGSIPVALPLLLLLWIPALITTWPLMMSVRTSPTGIAAARPWRSWDEIPWALIERAERHGLRLVIRASDGRRIAFVPLILYEGSRLRREVLLRLPPHVLDEHLRADARDLLGESAIPRAEGGPPTTLHARPRTGWRWAAGCVGAGAVLVGGAAGLALAPPWGVAIAALCLSVAAVSAAVLVWLTQQVIVSEAGMRVVWPLGRQVRDIAWQQIQLIEQSPGERVLRLRGDRRLRCPGPALFPPLERDQMRAFLRDYCTSRGVPVARRRWL